MISPRNETSNLGGDIRIWEYILWGSMSAIEEKPNCAYTLRMEMSVFGIVPALEDSDIRQSHIISSPWLCLLSHQGVFYW